MHLEIPALSPDELSSLPEGESSDQVRLRVAACLVRQWQRQGKANSRIDSGEIDQLCPLAPAALSLLKQAASRLGLSARGWHRVIRLARTIADLASEDTINSSHISEAIHYRRLAAGFGE